MKTYKNIQYTSKDKYIVTPVRMAELTGQERTDVGEDA